MTMSRGNLVSPADNVDMYDDSMGYDDETGVKLASNLTPEERRQAVKLYRLFNELWGLCLIVGDPGTGKDLFGNYISYKLKTYFPWKRILRDEKPRKLFGSYAGLFNEYVLHDELSRMRELARGARIAEYDRLLEKAADDWVTSNGQVLLKNSVLYLTEFWNYCYKRNPHNPMNKTMGGIHKVKRHLDVLVLGTTQQVSDLDRFTCLPWVDWKVTCTRSVANSTGFVYFVQKVKYDRRKELLLPINKPFLIAFDAGRPRSDLGDGKIVVRKPNYTPETEEERIILDVIRAGVDTYDDIVDLVLTHGDMSEDEVLATLKGLKFIRRKRVIDYPCYFGLYNSKRAPQLSTNLRVSD